MDTTEKNYKVHNEKNEQFDFNISRKWIKNLIQHYDNIDINQLTYKAFELAKKVVMCSEAKILKNSNKNSHSITFSEEEAKKIVLDFYKNLDSDYFNVVNGIFNGTNPDFELIMYDPNNYQNASRVPCTTTKEETEVGVDAKIDNIICFPIEDYRANSQSTMFSLEQVIAMLHECAHAIAMTRYCNKNEEGHFDYSIMEGQMQFMFGETESKTMELLFGNYIMQKFPEYKMQVLEYISQKFINETWKMQDPYIMLGIANINKSKVNIMDLDVSETLEKSEIEEIANILGISNPEIVAKRLSRYNTKNTDEKFRYLLGRLLAVQIITKSKNAQEVVKNLNTLFDEIKNNEDSEKVLLDIFLKLNEQYGEKKDLSMSDVSDILLRDFIHYAKQIEIEIEDTIKSNDSIGKNGFQKSILKQDIILASEEPGVVFEKEDAQEAIRQLEEKEHIPEKDGNEKE